MSIKNFIKEHFLGHHYSDDIASFIGGSIFANIFTMQFASHILEVAIVGLIGGAAGLVGKLFIQFSYDKFIKSKNKQDEN